MNHLYLKGPLADDIHPEETNLFAAIQNNCSVEPQQQSATHFQEAKK